MTQAELREQYIDRAGIDKEGQGRDRAKTG
jgi:hypothetical protein